MNHVAKNVKTSVKPFWFLFV